METINEEMDKQKEWYEQAKGMTTEALPEFIRHLTEDYDHDYGTICHAITAAALAAARSVDKSPSGGITGFQAGAVMWEFITNWMIEYKEKPLRLVNFENMLYPQYEDRFSKTVPQETRDWLVEKAKEGLQEKNMHPDVKQHMESIASGALPWGYVVGQES